MPINNARMHKQVVVMRRVHFFMGFIVIILVAWILYLLVFLKP